MHIRSAWRRLRTWSRSVALILSLAAAAFSQGIVVEDVGKGSQGETSGLQAGDVVVAWSRGAAQGSIDSPFDFADVELEQGQRGAVTLRGRRGSEDRTWLIDRGSWAIQVRPALLPELLNVYLDGRRSANDNKAIEAANLWQSIAVRARKADGPVVVAWLLAQGAAVLASARHWIEADKLYASAVDFASAAPKHVGAQLLQARAETYYSRDQWALAQKRYEESIARSQEIARESVTIARSFRGLGRVFLRSGDLAAAEKSYSQARDIQARLCPGSLEFASSLNGLGSVALEHGQFERAEELYREALAIRERIAPGSMDVAGSYYNLGCIADDRGLLADAENSLRRALAIYQTRAPGSKEVASTLNVLGVVTAKQGDPIQAAELYRQALAIVQRLAPDSYDETFPLGNLANLAYKRGDFAAAEEHSQSVLAILSKVTPNSIQVAGTHLNLGNFANARHDLESADEHFRIALEKLERIAPGSLFVAKCLGNLGDLARRRGHYETADQYFRRALAIIEKQAPETLEMSTLLGMMGDLAGDLGDATRKQEHYLAALAIEERIAPASLPAASSLFELGQIALERGDRGKADEYHRKAAEIRGRLAPDSAGYADSLHALGSILVREGKVDDAVPLMSRAVDALERQGGRLGGDEDLRAGFRAQFAGLYRDYIDLLLAQKEPAGAFHVLERSRARSMLALLAERDLTYSADLAPDIRRARLRNRAEYDRVQAQIAELNPVKDSAKIDPLIKRLRSLAAERSQIAEQIRRASPRLAGLQYPEPLDLAGAQRVLDPGSCLLTYSVGKDKTVLMMVDAGQGISVSVIPAGERNLRTQVNEFRDLIQRRDIRSRASLKRLARSLYDLLILPAEARLAAAKRVLLIPDGPLHVLPFAALLRTEKQYLVEWKPLHTSISVTVYAHLKESRKQRTDGPIDLIAFGDPEYRATDAHKNRSADFELRSAVQRGLALARLPYSRQEVVNIASLFPDRNRTFLGADATEERAKSLGSGTRYLHFAAHGFVDERLPLNSALVLTLPEKATEGRQNGLLQAWEIFEEVRWDADLVVLSACETGLGQELAGEGLIGLTRALHYAGARSVLATLWKVDDRRTALLMERFYRHLRDGRDKDQALRSAQLDLLKSPASAHPVHWAAFRLNGDWK